MLESETKNRNDIISTPAGVEALNQDFFTKFNSAIILNDNNQSNQEELTGIVTYLVEQIRNNIKTDEQLSDLLDELIKRCVFDKYVDEEAVQLYIGHGLSKIWARIQTRIFPEPTLEQLYIIDKKLHYTSSSVLTDIECLITQRFSDSLTKKILEERLLTGNNQLHSTIDIWYDYYCSNKEGSVTAELYLDYLKMIKYTIETKSELSSRIIKSLRLANAKRYGMGSKEGDELVEYLDRLQKTLMDNK